MVYPLSLVNEKWPKLYPFFVLNPMTGIVEGFRWAILGVAGEPPLFPREAASIAWADPTR